MKLFLSEFEHKGIKATEDQNSWLTCECGDEFKTIKEWIIHVNNYCPKRKDEN